MTGIWKTRTTGIGLWAWAILAPAMAAATAPSDASIRDGVLVRCESFKFRAVACPAASQANVRLAKVLGGRCIAGITWFYDRRAIHVRGGCRAVFIVGGAAPTAAQGR